jgi:ABC-type methionine transport system ATPase subunit
MANTQPAEKRFRIHYPLERISAPVVTHLVTDYDLSPNLLRADVDARTGGWLVVGLTGGEATLQAALQWLRDQGLDVAEEA